LKAALEAEKSESLAEPPPANVSSSELAPTLHEALAAADKKVGKIKIVPLGS
jgi:hypothetical protein